MKIFTVQGRGFGDAVICSAALRACKLREGSSYVVAGKKSNLCVLRTLGVSAEWVDIPFPASTGKQCDLASLYRLLRAGLQLRRRSFDLGVNVAPDFREDLLFRIVKPRRTVRAFYGNLSDATQKFHAFNLLRYGQEVDLSNELRGIYWQQAALFAKATGCPEPQNVVPLPRRSDNADLIGVHPFAGHPSREWPLTRWRQFIDRLLANGSPVVCFCPPGGRSRLERAGIIERNGLQIAEDGIEDFCRRVQTLRLLVCHESFAAHVAIYFGVPKIVISGSGDPDVWLGGQDYLTAGDKCPWFPCHGRPKCTGKSDQYICVNGVDITIVEKAVLEALRKF